MRTMKTVHHSSGNAEGFAARVGGFRRGLGSRPSGRPGFRQGARKASILLKSLQISRVNFELPLGGNICGGMSEDQEMKALCPKCGEALTYVTSVPHPKSPAMRRTTFVCYPCNRTRS